MYISDERIDKGKNFDWGRVSADYAKYRDIYPDEFYQRLVDLGVCIKGQSVLDKMLTMDDGATMLGEVALIPVDSPINNSGILFYETLFDENASCHLALGHGFNECLKGFESLTQEQLKEKGINDSMIHVDFMIGTKDMNIVGVTKDGTRVEIFRNGNWAF